MKKTIIDSFRNEFGFLSNFYEATIYVDGKRFTSVEHAYQASKSLNEETRELIRKAKTPALAKKLGQSVELRKDWDSVKIDLMREYIKKKFENPFLRPLLLATEDAELVEGNTWNDFFWGICRGKGKNWLGRLLMKERDRIRFEEYEEITKNTPEETE